MSGTPQDVGGGDAALRPGAPAAGDNAAPPEEIKTDAEGASAEPAQGDANPEQQPESEQATEEKKRKRDGGWQRQVRRLEKELTRLEAERDLALASAREKPQQQTQSQSSDEPRAPRLEDFRSYEEYERADRAYVADKATREAEKRFKAAEAERTAKAEREAQAKRMKEAAERFNKSAEDVAEHYEDFADVMDDLWRGRIPVIRNNDAVAQYLIEESDRGPELAYHLANNEKDAERIGKLSPLAQVKELVKLEASLPKPNAPATKAPPPPRNVGGRGGSDAKDPEKMSIDEMRKATGSRRIVDY